MNDKANKRRWENIKAIAVIGFAVIFVALIFANQGEWVKDLSNYLKYFSSNPTRDIVFSSLTVICWGLIAVNTVDVSSVDVLGITINLSDSFFNLFRRQWILATSIICVLVLPLMVLDGLRYSSKEIEVEVYSEIEREELIRSNTIAAYSTDTIRFSAQPKNEKLNDNPFVLFHCEWEIPELALNVLDQSGCEVATEIKDIRKLPAIIKLTTRANPISVIKHEEEILISVNLRDDDPSLTPIIREDDNPSVEPTPTPGSETPPTPTLLPSPTTAPDYPVVLFEDTFSNNDSNWDLSDINSFHQRDEQIVVDIAAGKLSIDITCNKIEPKYPGDSTVCQRTLVIPNFIEKNFDIEVETIFDRFTRGNIGLVVEGAETGSHYSFHLSTEGEAALKKSNSRDPLFEETFQDNPDLIRFGTSNTVRISFLEESIYFYINDTLLFLNPGRSINEPSYVYLSVYTYYDNTMDGSFDDLIITTNSDTQTAK